MVSDDAQLTQDTKCPQGKNTTPISSVKHILHALASSIGFEDEDLEGTTVDSFVLFSFSPTLEGSSSILGAVGRGTSSEVELYREKNMLL